MHADEEMDEDGLTVFDVESAILTGSIIEQQRDRQTRERKYVVRGEAVDGRMIEVVGKVSRTGRLVILTTYKG